MPVGPEAMSDLSESGNGPRGWACRQAASRSTMSPSSHAPMRGDAAPGDVNVSNFMLREPTASAGKETTTYHHGASASGHSTTCAETSSGNGGAGGEALVPR